jgi:CubicO group peptidase (beta-lactamase class C family)
MRTANVLPRSIPEEQGVSSSAIMAFLDAVERSKLELHGFMLLRHGHVVAEGWWAPYGPDRPHMLFSLSKSFTSTAVGFAVSEGRLSVDDPVISFFPEATPKLPDPLLAAMRVRDLLTMSVGHAKPIMGSEWRQNEGDWVKHFLQIPMDHQPGTRFMYNSGATYMLSAIVQQVTGLALLDYLQPRLFKPLGINVDEWDTCPSGINTGGWGLTIKTEDLVRFGLFYLRKGKWNGEQFLPEAWIEEAASKQIFNGSDVESDSQQGYGYQFWRSRHGAYRADGAFGQFCVVLPDQDAVVAINGGISDMQSVMNLIWEHLLPAMEKGASLYEKAACNKEAVHDDEASAQLLKNKLQQLSLLPPQAQTHSPLVARISGKYFKMEPNPDKVEAISFEFGEDSCTFSLRDDRGEHRICCGLADWIEGETSMTGQNLHHQYQPPIMRFAANGRWTDENTFIMTWCFVETPFCDTIVCHFQENHLRLERSVNVNSGPRERPFIYGKMLQFFD